MNYQELTGFGIKNFRVFKEYQEFQFRPITILTGPNNSGKSSLIKALLLFEENWSNVFPAVSDNVLYLDKPLSYQLKLNFLSETLNLGGQKLVLNESNKPLDFLFRFGKYSYCFEFNNGGDLIYDYKLCREKDEVIIHQYGGDLRIDLILFKEYLLEYPDLKMKDEYKAELLEIIYALDNSISSGNGFLALNIEEGSDGNLEIKYTNDRKKSGSYELYDEYIDSSLLDTSKINIDIIDYNLFFTLKFFFKKLLNINGEFDQEFLELIFPGLRNPGNHILNLPSFNHLPSIKGPMKRYIDINDKDKLSSLIQSRMEQSKDQWDFIDWDPNGKFYRGIYAFFDKWINKFELGKRIDYKKDEKSGVVIFEIDGKSLVDYGYGITQLAAIFLWLSEHLPPEKSKIPISIYQYLVLEEPEANLHPSFQSLLAEMISEVAKKFHCKFIIETHSEYFVRKLQYLTAKKEIKPEDTVIYYFNHPKEVEKGAEQVKEIKILEDGSLSDDFGTGFFDEADKIALELYSIQRKKTMQN